MSQAPEVRGLRQLNNEVGQQLGLAITLFRWPSTHRQLNLPLAFCLIVLAGMFFALAAIALEDSVVELSKVETFSSIEYMRRNPLDNERVVFMLDRIGGGIKRLDNCRGRDVLVPFLPSRAIVPRGGRVAATTSRGKRVLKDGYGCD